MTDRVLTENEVEQLASLNETMLNGLPKADACVLIASHRLLQKRRAELENKYDELLLDHIQQAGRIRRGPLMR